MKALQFLSVKLLKILTVVFAENRRMKSFRWTAHATVALALVYIAWSLFTVRLDVKSFEIVSKIGKFLLQLVALVFSLSFDLHM